MKCFSKFGLCNALRFRIVLIRSPVFMMNRSPFDKYIVPIVIEKMNLHICNMFTYNKNNCTIEEKGVQLNV